MEYLSRSIGALWEIIRSSNLAHKMKVFFFKLYNMMYNYKTLFALVYSSGQHLIS